ncbi:right-handed parallel beta-helix repeat-containing protein [Sphaerothrix gracilis]|uniref:right-handed parallel beta-helix repeat-containing protein n=1 Tax=Sphaerothrix gracilis TaxID=3151835 RepID=UPI0031FC3FBE
MNINSRSFYVSPNGNNNNPGTKDQPWKDISYAVSQKSPVEAGDTVLVQSGTYREIIDLEKSGNSQQGHITLKADGNVVLQDPNPNKGGFRKGVIQSAGESHWIIDGFRIENTSWAGISLRDADNMIVQNNHTYETGASGIIVMPDKYFGGGDAEVTSSNIKVLNNTVERANWKWKTKNDSGSPQEALSIWGVDGFEVAGNLVKDTKKEGIDIKTGSRNGSVHDNTVTGAAQVSGTYAGQRGGPAIYVDGNRADTFNIDIYNNTVHNNTADGIVIADEVGKIGNVSDVRVYNNLVYDNGLQGVNGGVGIMVKHNVKDVTVVNNTLSGNIQGFFVGGGLPEGYTQVDGVLIRNNIFADSKYRNGNVNNASNLTLDNNLFTDGFNELYETRGSVVNLRDSQNTTVKSVGFVDADKKDFRLAKSSAAIDIGSEQLGGYAQAALNDVQRPNGSGVDVGAYEFLSSDLPTTPADPVAPAPSIPSTPPSTPPTPVPQNPNSFGGDSSPNLPTVGGDPNTSDGTDTDPVIISGDASNNVLWGGAENEQIKGFAGRDKIFGRAGDDDLFGDEGNDLLRGDEGDDEIAGGDGNDKLFGGDDDDVLFGEAGRDRLIGNDGDDTLYGGDANDLHRGGNGNDTIFGGDGDDKLFGNDGDDMLSGDDGNDYIRGAAGDDVMEGGSGNDLIFGNAGNDLLNGGTGRDRLIANEGDDVVIGGDDSDLLRGGSGNDQLAGGDGDDRLFGNSNDDVLEGGSGNDLVVGGSGQDQLIGTSSGVASGAEQDVLLGGQGADTFWLGDTSQSFYANAGQDDYALVRDFRASQGDTIQLHGSADQYSLGSTSTDQPKGTAIYLNASGGEELIAVVKGNATLDLNSSDFNFV